MSKPILESTQVYPIKYGFHQKTQQEQTREIMEDTISAHWFNIAEKCNSLMFDLIIEARDKFLSLANWDELEKEYERITL